jgi:hypothetical protein
MMIVITIENTTLSEMKIDKKIRKWFYSNASMPISLGGIKIRSLLDTGSTISAINEQLFLKSKFANKSLKQPNISHIIAYKV